MRKITAKDRKIGKVNVNFRPYEIDMKEIDSLTKNEFDGNQAEALRKLTREALVRRRLVTEGKDATMSIVRDSQGKVMDARLQPLILQIDKLIEQVRILTEANANLSKNISNATQNISSDVAHIYEKINTLSEAGNQSKIIQDINFQLSSLTTLLQPLAANSSTSLQNVISLRSLFYVFLLAYQTGSIEEANKLNRSQWVYFVRDVQRRANKLSVEEYRDLDSNGQHKFIEDYAKQIFDQVRIVKESDIKKITS
jgi:hypothetical protein